MVMRRLSWQWTLELEDANPAISGTCAAISSDVCFCFAPRPWAGEAVFTAGSYSTALHITFVGSFENTKVGVTFAWDGFAPPGLDLRSCHHFSPNSVGTLRGSYGKRKSRCA